MGWDLVWHRHKDLEFSANMDVAIIGGDELLQQRIVLRLIMMRGWIYDTTGELGSNLHTALDDQMNKDFDALPALVLQALDPISSEITVTDVIIRESPTDSRAVEAIVEYVKNSQLGAPGSTQTVVFPLR